MTPDVVPNPDFYTAVLWKRLVGEVVLAVKGQEAPLQSVRTYAYCGSALDGTVVLTTMNLNTADTAVITTSGFTTGATRNEYLLQGLGGNYTSPNMTLNGQVLSLGPGGALPLMQPVKGDATKPI